MLHSSDNEIEAREYLSYLSEEFCNDIENKVKIRNSGYFESQNVVRKLSKMGEDQKLN